MSQRPLISAYIIVKNEAHNIEAAIHSIQFADEIIILDTGSSDGTQSLAKRLGAKVIETPFEGFGKARQTALAACQHPWVLTIDADERITPELKQEILQHLAQNQDAFIGYAPTKNIVLDTWLKHGGWSPDYRLPVFFAKSALTYKDDFVHEGIETSAAAHYFKHARLHYPYQDMNRLLSKANQYSSYGVDKLRKKNQKPSLWAGLGHATWKFIKQYLIRGAFLDGWPGFIFSVNAFNETFFKYLKHYEQANQIKSIILSRTDNIGDVVLSLPMAALLKQAYPNAKIIFLARNYVRAVVEAYPHIDQFVSSDELLAADDRAACQQLKALEADAIIHVFPNARLAKLAKQAKIRMRVGTSRRWYHLLHCNHRVNFSRAKSNAHEAQLNLKLLAPFHCPDQYTLNDLAALGQLQAPALADHLKALIDPNRIQLILHPLSNGHAREWPMAHYRALIEKLPNQFQIFITGSPAERERLAEPLLQHCPQVEDVCGRLSLDDLVSLIAHSDILLAASTGPLHIAAACGIHAIGLFAPIKNIDAKRWGPVGKNAIVIEADSAADDCMQDIRVERVANQLSLIAKSSKKAQTSRAKAVAAVIS